MVQQFIEKIDKAVRQLEDRLNTPEVGMAEVSSPTLPPQALERAKIEDSLIELAQIRAAVQPPNSSWPDIELRRRLHDVLTRHGVIDPATPRP